MPVSSSLGKNNKTHRKGPARDIAHRICQPSGVLIGGATLNSEFGLQNGPSPSVGRSNERLRDLRKVRPITSLTLTALPEKYPRLLFPHHSPNTQTAHVKYMWSEHKRLPRKNQMAHLLMLLLIAWQTDRLGWISDSLPGLQNQPPFSQKAVERGQDHLWEVNYGTL